MLIFLSSRTPSTLLLTWSPFHCFTSMISISVDYKPGKKKKAFSDQNGCGNEEPKADLVMLISKGRPFPGTGFELPQQVTLINCISSEEWESASQATLWNTFKYRQALELWYSKSAKQMHTSVWMDILELVNHFGPRQHYEVWQDS